MSKVVPLSRTFVAYIVPLVQPDQRLEWEAYSVQNDEWVNASIDFQRDFPDYHGPLDYHTNRFGRIHGDFADIPDNETRSLLPAWQQFPVLPNTPYTYNWDWLSSSIAAAPEACLQHHQTVISAPYMTPTKGNKVEEAETKAWAEYFRQFISSAEDPYAPVSDLFYLIVNEINRVHVVGAEDYNASEHQIVGVIAASVYWRSVLRRNAGDSRGIHMVLENECTKTFTYKVDGLDLEYLGVGDHHESRYDDHGIGRKLHTLSGFEAKDSVYSGAPIHKDFCPITLKLYPSDEFKEQFTTKNPLAFAIAVVVIFCAAGLVFVLYDSKVERRQQIVASNAKRSAAIVSSLFPSEVRDQLFPLPDDDPKNGKLNAFRTGFAGRTQDGTAADDEKKSLIAHPIASLYPETTVLFADIVGFTSWSSSRQPAQVFHLLESVYAAFDEIAKLRGVYKVETIGDSYVAVVGLPVARKNHAVVMVRFASDSRIKMRDVTADLEKTLGPGTADLRIRIGLNSGPTTGGVLRGDKARFQLFGDTVNTAARMESNGERDKIQVSEKTADLLREAGKGHWLTPRTDRVFCKGKGLLSTYWVDPNSKASSIVASETSGSAMYTLPDSDVEATPEMQRQRLVDWNVDLFTELLKEVVQYGPCKRNKRSLFSRSSVTALRDVHPLEEVADIISMHKSRSVDLAVAEDIEISPQVSQQLKTLITTIGSMYRDNAFHNFEHASHVTMSTKKLLDRIHELLEVSSNDDASNILDGISFDPIAKFAILFAALIHDVDHPGVSNAQLAKEQCPMAVAYNGRSVAEQNSIDVGWNMLMETQYQDLRRCMFAYDADFARFRQIAVNVVMATDLFDKDLKARRESRWEKSFQSGLLNSFEDLTREHANRRATIVIDLVIQASDVSHTMQHFTVYRKWNERLLAEMYSAYRSGRLVKDPLEGWYEGELWFFDNYVIPLAQKLRECGVFGVSCDEFLDYAKDNRKEWEVKGRDIVREAAKTLQSSPKPDAYEAAKVLHPLPEFEVEWFA